MIKFKSIRYKNFLSTGSQFTEIQLDRSPTTLVIGSSGHGKSTILDAICLALFNTPFRNINKPLLVNSVNKKDCQVEIEFHTKGKDYKIIRGIKPNKFEIYEDNNLIDQTADSRNYQKHLEDNILGFNFEAFTQIIILGSATYTPFMSLGAPKRREIIESLLGIDIFTGMNVTLSKKVKANKEALRVNENNLELTKEKAKVQKDYIDNLVTDKASRESRLKAQLEEINANIEAEDNTQKSLSSELFRLQDIVESLTKDKDTYEKCNECRRNFNSELRTLNSQVSELKDSDKCPACGQKVDNSSKLEHLKEVEIKIEDLKSKISKLDTKLVELEPSIETLKKTENSIREIKSDLKVCDSKKIGYNKQIEQIEAQLQEDLDSKIEASKNILKEYASKGSSLVSEKAELGEEKRYLEICQVLLKDDGIKSKIVKQYLGTINRIVNTYLEKLDLFVSFELDETFTESIKSRHRDDFVYENFSEGEKKRVDISIMFSFREVARLRNSMHCNLLFADEILDSSLDSNSKSLLLDFLPTVAENIFVISHDKESYIDKFRSIIEFKKVNGYSVII